MKRGDPLGWALRVGSLMLSGVYYPVDVLPCWLRSVGQALPLTHSLELAAALAAAWGGLCRAWRRAAAGAAHRSFGADRAGCLPNCD